MKLDFNLNGRLTALMAAGVALSLAAMTPAHAASYTFDVEYYGSGTALLAAGSDPMVGTMLEVGDEFTYTLTGMNGVFYTLGGGDIFPFIALTVDESATREVDYFLSLSYLGGLVYTVGGSGITNEFVHIGANGANLPGSLVFDTITLSTVLLSSTDSSTIAGILPIFGSPDQNGFSPGVVYYGAVPEPATWAMMLLGCGLVGGLLRRRTAIAVSFA